MLRFEGDKEILRSLPEVWAKLSDARFLIQCIPDLEAVHQVDPDQAQLTIRPGLAFVRGNLETTVRLHDRNEPNGLRIDLLSKGIGSSSRVAITLLLSATGTGTHVHWSAEVQELTGLLKLVPSGLIKGAAQKVIGDIWNLAVRKLEEGEEGSTAS